MIYEKLFIQVLKSIHHLKWILTCLNISTSQFATSIEMDSDEFTLFG